jgi:hypothetical protein
MVDGESSIRRQPNASAHAARPWNQRRPDAPKQHCVTWLLCSVSSDYSPLGSVVENASVSNGPYLAPPLSESARFAAT